ncbi:MAG: pitrilysin family protein [Thermodesulfobacteriota bacterium]
MSHRKGLCSSVTRYDHSNTYRKSVLNNGVRVVTERIPYLQSVSLGIWVRSGSRFERPEVNGICHFIEHMLFKGTNRRSALSIAKEIDSVGGVMNAFTSKEVTAFYCKVLSEHCELAVDLLTDIFLESSFPEEEIEREKQVVYQEISQLEDCPEDLVHEILGIRFWKDDPLGQPILGTIDNIGRLDRNTMMQFKLDNYTPEEIVVCAVGDVDHDNITNLFEKQMNRLHTTGSRICAIPPATEASAHVIAKDLEQVHVCIGTIGPSAADRRRQAGYVLNAILGSGMSSRLFQEIREKRGLAYSVYSFLSSFSDTGMFGIYAACEAARLEELMETIGKETMGLASSLTEEEIRTAKNYIRGSIILAMESPDARMNRLTKGEYFFGRYVSVEEILEALEAVTLAELRELCDDMFSSNRFSVVALGPAPEDTDLFGLLGL